VSFVDQRFTYPYQQLAKFAANFSKIQQLNIAWNLFRPMGVYKVDRPLNDADLMTRARRGDTDAWETMTRQHQEAVFRLAYLILGDPADADDVAQETFIRAHRALDRFDASKAARPWLFSIATNLARNKLRSVGRYVAAVQRFFLADPDAGVQAPPEANGGQSQLLWQAVRKLNETDQEVIYLRYFSELSEAETAQALGVATGTVKSRTHRALERLRVVVEREFPSLRESILE
jgi:RNA polymerase sigma-70 factor, ECF subfamily